MPDPDRPPVFNILDSAEAIYSKRRQFRIVLLWAVFASIWIISVSTLFGLYTFGPKDLQTVEIYIVVVLSIFLGLPIFIASVFVLPISWNSSNRLEDFMANFHPIWVKMQAEGESIRGGGEEKVANQLLRKLMPGYKNMALSSKVSKKIDSHMASFDIIKYRRKKLAVIKLLTPGDSIDKDAIIELEKDALAKTKKAGYRIDFFALVQDQYGIDFTDWEGEDFLTGSGCMVLFLERSGKWLSVKWVSPIKKRPLIK